MIDIHARKLIHTVIETISINHADNFAWVKWKKLEHNPLYDKTYYKFPRIIKNNRIITVNRLKIYKASIKLLHAYEKKKMNYLKALTKRSLETIAREEKKKFPITDDEIINRINKEKLDWKNTNLVSAYFSIGRHRTYRIQYKMGMGL